MSCDITKVFTSIVRALTATETSLSRKTSTASSLDTRPGVADVFSDRAISLRGELTTVRKHIANAGELSLALATNDAARQRMYHELAKQINQALDQCSILLAQLKCLVVPLTSGTAEAGDEASSKTQLQLHREAVCRSLEDFLKVLERARDEQVTTYCRRLELTSRLSGSVSTDSYSYESSSSPTSTVRNRRDRGNAWLFGGSKADAEALPTSSLPVEELKQLEMENAEVYLRFLSEKNEIQQLGNQIAEIGRLQAMVTESLIEQAEMAQHIGEKVVGSTELVREANEHVRQSMDRTRGILGRRNFGLLQKPILSASKTDHVSGQNSLTVVTGIQPTGYPHLGNYYGMIKPCVRLQYDSDVSRLFLLLADLHALTKGSADNSLSTSTLQLASALIACGINPVLSSDVLSSKGKSIIFPQSSVIGHCELTWILSSKCSVNRLSHLPQWREKSEALGTTGSSVGLFTYPLLQAADILLYSADVVPVGLDQVTHLELTRDLARILLTQSPSLCDYLKVPDVRVTELPKVHNLRLPTKKMSKSFGPEAGTVWLTDPPDVIKTKVERAQTDSIRELTYDPEYRPGVANLIHIFAAAKDLPVEVAVDKLTKLTKVDLKAAVIDALVEELVPIQSRLRQLEISGSVEEALRAGSRAANQVASQNLRKIMEAFGFPSYYN
ncbi:unnamed protein product [Mesocestoides corti]|uniref:tryptophan--tRNA ligase n=2 Tax=Mesocestoides corti TaxID=53468 RepID=A0A0R3UKD5_MESCO|nr:unnamed protein product [Mesocestoides corti]